MASPSSRGSRPELPPDLPPEYAEAYVAAFDRAYAEARANLGIAERSGAGEAEDARVEDPEILDPDDEHRAPAETWAFEPPEEPVVEWQFEPPATTPIPARPPAPATTPDPEDEPDPVHLRAEADRTGDDDRDWVVPGFVVQSAPASTEDRRPTGEPTPPWIALAVVVAVAVVMLALLLSVVLF